MTEQDPLDRDREQAAEWDTAIWLVQPASDDPWEWVFAGDSVPDEATDFATVLFCRKE